MEYLEQFDVSSHRRLTIMKGNITRLAVDAIVNAANEQMLGGGGVDGAIHAAAGPELYEACLLIPEVAKRVRCPRAEARITPGFRLPARYVIHTVGPWYESAEISGPILRRAHESCLRLADERNLGSLAFPAISCGVFGYPPAEAASIALSACHAWPGPISDIRFVLFDFDTYEIWRMAARSL
jgi:O-acetyl-ADP-ribose deacetylase (regulator of RNase III)